MLILPVVGIVLGYVLGQKALKKNMINGVPGTIALLIVMSFTFTTVWGWCNFIRHSQQASLLCASWAALGFCAWLGLFIASLCKAYADMHNPKEWKFSSLSDKYEIIYDNPQRENNKAPIAVKKSPEKTPTEPSDIKLPFEN